MFYFLGLDGRLLFIIYSCIYYSNLFIIFLIYIILNIIVIEVIILLKRLFLFLRVVDI